MGAVTTKKRFRAAPLTIPVDAVDWCQYQAKPPAPGEQQGLLLKLIQLFS